MKTPFKIFFMLFVFYDISFSQPITWQRWYDYGNYDNDGQDVIQTFDGGYLILGNNNVPFNYSSILIKINYLGNVEWQKLIDRSLPGNANISSYAVEQSKDSGYVISGDSNGDSAFLIKTNKIGEIQWVKKFSSAGMQASFFDHKLTIDGGIIACGSLFPPFRGLVVKTDSLGIVQWDSVYNSPFGKIVESPDSNFYLLSSGLMKINSIGKQIWFTSFPYFMNSLAQDSSGHIFTAGGTDSMNLLKYDTSGALLFQRSYYVGAFCFTMCVSKDQNILIAGEIDTLIQNDIAVVKVNLDGEQIFKKRIETVKGNWFKIPYSVKSTNDYGFIFTGFTDYPQFPYRDNILAVKTDSSCNAPLIVGINKLSPGILSDFILKQNYPNPFNPFTIIEYELSKTVPVKIVVYDVMGKVITTLVNEVQTQGRYKMLFDAEFYNISSGLYFYKLETGNNSEFNKMMYLK